MFESVAPDPTAVRQGRARFYGTLPASLLLHGIAALAWLVGESWEIEFPTQVPRLIAPYSLADAPPPPPPPPPPPAPPKQTVQVVKLPEVRPEEIVAPTVIPDVIPEVKAPEPTPPEVVTEGVEGGIEGGVEGGVVGGEPEGVPGGVVGGVPGGVVDSVVDGRVVIPRDEELELESVSKDYPIYPGQAHKNGWEDQLVVRYVIGRNGRVRDVSVVVPAQRKIFDDAAVEAIRTWRFRPMKKDGKRVEVVHELTVFFKLRRVPK